MRLSTVKQMLKTSKCLLAEIAANINMAYKISTGMTEPTFNDLYRKSSFGYRINHSVQNKEL